MDKQFAGSSNDRTDPSYYNTGREDEGKESTAYYGKNLNALEDGAKSDRTGKKKMPEITYGP